MKRFFSIFMALVLLLALLPVAFAEDMVLFQGEAVGKYAYADKNAVSLNLSRIEFNKSLLSSPFSVHVQFDGEIPPVLVFSSWTGGPSSATITAAKVSNGIAVYSYADIRSSYGDAFDKLNSITVKTNGATVTVYKVTISPAEEDETVFNYNSEGKACQWLSDITAGWNLGNTFDSYGDWIGNHQSSSKYETAWGNPITTADVFYAVKAAGFDAVRIPTTWAQHIDNRNHYTVDTEWMDRVQQVVDMALAADLKVILNIHHDTGTNGWLRAEASTMGTQIYKFSRLWEQIALRFSDYDDKLAFEGFNEILNLQNDWNCTGKTEGEAVNLLNQVFVDVVRSTGGNNASRILFVNSYAASNNPDVLANFTMPQDTVENCLVAQVHMYSPIDFCFTFNEGYKETQWQANNGKAVVDGVFSTLHNTFVKNGIPVIIGEFACGGKNNEEQAASWAAYVMECCHREGIVPFWWDNGGQVPAKASDYHEMGLLDRRTCTWIFPAVVEAITGVQVTNVHP